MHFENLISLSFQSSLSFIEHIFGWRLTRCDYARLFMVFIGEKIHSDGNPFLSDVSLDFLQLAISYIFYQFLLDFKVFDLSDDLFLLNWIGLIGRIYLLEFICSRTDPTLSKKNILSLQRTIYTRGSHPPLSPLYLRL